MLSDGWAVITGATRGIGLGIARRLRADGYRILAVARDAEALDRLAQELGPDVCGISPTDLRDPAAVQTLARRVRDEHRPLRVIVNNAATVDHLPFAQTTSAQWEDTIRLNLLAPVELVRRLHDVMEPPASIVNVGSVLGTLPSRSATPYIVAKGGLHHATKALALELANAGIRVNAVAPGFIATDMFVEGRSNAEQAHIGRSHPLRRVGQVNEVAAAVSFLCSPDASFITGAILPVDGGLACQMSVTDLGATE